VISIFFIIQVPPSYYVQDKKGELEL
jgi:hypothetical protein